MESNEEIRQLIISINQISDGDIANKPDEAHIGDLGARLLIFMERAIEKSELVNYWTPKDYSLEIPSILDAVFSILEHMSRINSPFNKSQIWTDYCSQVTNSSKPLASLSFYELAFSRSCAWICQLLGDKIQYVQKLLIKNLFGKSNSCSLLASDLYVFLLRIVNPHHKMSMCLIIMNLCKISPPEATIKGAALINRLKHPIVNFENPKYQHLLDF